MKRINSPHPQSGPVLFAALCALGSAFALGGLLSLEVGSEPWLAGVLGLVIILAGFLVIEIGWLWIQREIRLAEDAIVVRRWIEVLTGREGRRIPIDAGTRISITLENLRSIRIERNGESEGVVTLGYWEQRQVRKLVDALRDLGALHAKYWKGEYPPDLTD